MKIYNVRAIDGELGKVKDIYFDDESWIVRYLIVDTLKWLPGRKVLVSPLAMDDIDDAHELVHIRETKDSIKESPKVSEAETVSKKHEQIISDYFDWPYYWSNQGIWGSFKTPRGLLQAYDNGQVQRRLERDVEVNYHLRSMNEIKGAVEGYRISAADGNIGRIVDFLIDDDNWKVRYFLVETGKWLPGKLVLISPDWIESVDWFDKEVAVDLTKEQIERGPEYETQTPINRDFEERLYDKYEKDKYWREYTNYYL